MKRCLARAYLPMVFLALVFLVLSSIASAQTQGWILVLPPAPTKERPTQPNVWAPMGEWSYVRAHDTASACEADKERVIEVQLTLFRRDYDNPVSKFAVQNWQEARCVPYELWWKDRK